MTQWMKMRLKLTVTEDSHNFKSPVGVTHLKIHSLCQSKMHLFICGLYLYAKALPKILVYSAQGKSSIQPLFKSESYSLMWNRLHIWTGAARDFIAKNCHNPTLRTQSDSNPSQEQW